MDLLRALACAPPDTAIVWVVGTQGSTPRHAGAAMLVRADGSIAGTIGGGAVEVAAIARAVEVAKTGGASVETHHLVRDLAMCCGGSMELFTLRLGDNQGVFAQASDALAKREAVTLIATLAGDLRLTPGAGALDRRGDEFFFPVTLPERLILFGAGHVSQAIGPLAKSVGFTVIVCDDNETGALEPPPPWSDVQVSSFDVGDVLQALGELGANDSVLILTRDHAADERILRELLPKASTLDYLGVIGSRGKMGRFKKRILAQKPELEALWPAVRGPIGLDIGAETPEEIAVSVVAELVQQRRRGL